MSKYLEEPRNPGKDDGSCALCECEGLDEDSRTRGSGCPRLEECDQTAPLGQHLVLDHKAEEGED